MNNEIWKNVDGYSNYQVSNFGKVKSLNYNRTLKENILKLSTKKTGYQQVSLNKNGKQYFKSVHRLVAQAFIPNPDNLPQVNHKNEIKTDNRAENLEWCTAKYNRNYGTSIERAKPKISKANKGKHYSPTTEFKKGDNTKSVKCIELNKIFKSIVDASRELNISASNITNVCKHKIHNKTAGGYHFEYK